MTTKIKGKTGGDRPSHKNPHANNPNLFRAAIKAVIVRCALLGIIPAKVATQLIQRAGLKNA